LNRRNGVCLIYIKDDIENVENVDDTEGNVLLGGSRRMLREGLMQFTSSNEGTLSVVIALYTKLMTLIAYGGEWSMILIP